MKWMSKRQRTHALSLNNHHGECTGDADYQPGELIKKLASETEPRLKFLFS